MYHRMAWYRAWLNRMDDPERDVGLLDLLQLSVDAELHEDATHNRYADIARREGRADVAAVFESLARGEDRFAVQLREALARNPELPGFREDDRSRARELARRLLGLPFVQGKTGGTPMNLDAALIVEEFVATTWYPELARMAGNAGQDDLARLLENIARGERAHADALRKALGRGPSN